MKFVEQNWMLCTTLSDRSREPAEILSAGDAAYALGIVYSIRNPGPARSVTMAVQPHRCTGKHQGPGRRDGLPRRPAGLQTACQRSRLGESGGRSRKPSANGRTPW